MTGHDVTPTYGKRLRQESQTSIRVLTKLSFVPPPPYHESLLGLARELVMEHRTEHDYEVAVILCQMAAELVGEQVLERLIHEKGLAHVKRYLRRGKHPSANLADDRVRDLYVDLSEDRIQEAAFWPALKEHAERRDRIAHGGLRVSKQEAQASCDAVAELIEHLKRKHTVG